MSLAARYENRTGRMAAVGAAVLSLAAHGLLITAILYPWSVTVDAPVPAIDVTLIAIPELYVAVASLSFVRPPKLERVSAAVPVDEALPVPPTKPAPPVAVQDDAPAHVTEAPAPTRSTVPRRSSSATLLVTAWTKSEPLPLQYADVLTREFAAPAAKMTAPAQLTAHGPILDADMVAALQPDYPTLARRRGYQGRVVVAAAVLSSGEVEFASLVVSSGYDVLDHAALDAVRTWRLLPARENGEAVDGTIEIPFDFVLQ